MNNAFTMAHRLAPLSKWGSTADVIWSADTVADFDKLVMKYHSPFIRGATFQAMGVLRIPECEARLTAVAVDPYENKLVRQSAIRGLGLAQTSLAVECLARIASQRADVRKLACTTMQQVRDPIAIPALATAAESSSWQVRQAAAAALGATGRPETFHTLKLLASDDDYDVREAVARALSSIDLPTAVPVLGGLARDGVKQVRRAALEALNSRYPQIASQELINLAEDNSYPERVRVIRWLGHYVHPDIEEKLNDLLVSPDKGVRDAASDALRDLKNAV
jgi:HEAT repeat protein